MSLSPGEPAPPFNWRNASISDARPNRFAIVLHVSLFVDGYQKFMVIVRPPGCVFATTTWSNPVSLHQTLEVLAVRVTICYDIPDKLFLRDEIDAERSERLHHIVTLDRVK